MESTFEYFLNQEYDIFVQWLNPGHADASPYTDDLNISGWLLERGAVLCKRDGHDSPEERVKEIRQEILGWATYRDLVRTEF